MKVKNSVSTYKNLHFFFFHISKKHKYHLVFCLILMILTASLEILSIGLVIPFLGFLLVPEKLLQYEYINFIYNYMNFKSLNEFILYFCIFFSLIILFSSVIRSYLLYFQTKIAFNITIHIGSKVFDRCLNQTYETHLNRNSSEIVTALSSKISLVNGGLIMPCLSISTGIIYGSVVFIILAVFNPIVTLLSIIVISTFYLFIFLCFRKIIKRNGVSVNFYAKKSISIIQEALGGIRYVLIDNLQKLYIKNFIDSENNLQNSRANLQIIGGIPRFIIEPLFIIIFTWVGFYFFKNKENLVNLVPIIGALTLGIQRLLPVFQQAYAGWSGLNGAKESILSIQELLSQKIESISLTNKNIIKFEKTIKFQNIFYNYDNKKLSSLKDINFTIHKGDRIGIIGPTGSGKSTLLDLLMLLLKPKSGKILIDDKEIEFKDQKLWQANISHVSQFIYLADKSVKDNIVFQNANKEDSIQNIYKVAKMAQIADRIKKMEHKYDTIVGEQGVKLSGGERQRIGLARAFYKSKDVYVLDEATSALDIETENKIMNVINNFGRKKTIFIVTHRLNTLSICNKIIELKDNKINKIGTYNEIIGPILNKKT